MIAGYSASYYMKKPYLSVIIPAYNEAKRLPLTLIDVNKHLSKADFDYEIIVVDNNSKDATREVAERFTHLLKNTKVIECTIQGKGAAVRAGMLAAKGEHRMFMDADNSVSVDRGISALKYFKEGYGVVIGSRDVGGAKNDQPWYRQIAGNIGNLIIQVLLLPGLWDTQCPMKIFSAEAAEKVFPKMKINKWGFDVEVLALAKKFGYKIKEVPAIFINDPNSKVKASAYIKTFLEIFKIRLWLWFGKY